MSPRRWILVAGAMVLLFVGCSSDAGGEALAGFRAHESNPGMGMDAYMSGVLEIDEDSGCVWLSSVDGGERNPVVWPLGTEVQVDPVAIVLPDGQVIEPGGQVEGGGGQISAEAATSGLEPFPDECVHVGQAVVFNADETLTVTADVGLEVSDTFVSRFSTPEPIGLELLAVSPNDQSVAVVDFVVGTVHLYEPSDYRAPEDAIDGVSGGGGFIHVWANGTVSTYWPIDSDPLVYSPEPLREIAGIAPSLEVFSAPDGDHTWLVQPGIEGAPTLIELVNVVGLELQRILTSEIEGEWHQAGTTIEGLVVNSDEPEPHVGLVSMDGELVREMPGTAVSVGWDGAAVLRPDGSLVVTDAGLGDPIDVKKPRLGRWVPVGGPLVPSDSPPVVTGYDGYLVMLADDGQTITGDLMVIDPDGSAREIYEITGGPTLASWSRAGDWVVVVEGSSVSLVPADGGTPTSLGELIPESHWVLTAG